MPYEQAIVIFLSRKVPSNLGEGFLLYLAGFLLQSGAFRPWAALGR